MWDEEKLHIHHLSHGVLGTALLPSSEQMMGGGLDDTQACRRVPSTISGRVGVSHRAG